MMLKNVSLQVNDTFLFKDISFSLTTGNWTAIVGKSGVGKSTLIRLLAGLKVFGVVSGTITVPKGVAWMGQQDLLYPWLSILDNVLLPISLHRRVKKHDTEKAVSLLRDVGLLAKGKYYPKTLSGGQRQRVALARTLMGNATVVLMDEPFSALDAITKRQCQSLFHRMLKGKTVAIITHDVVEAACLADHIYVMASTPPYLYKTQNMSSPLPRKYDASDVLHKIKELWQKLEIDCV